jgi:hypothetical protein
MIPRNLRSLGLLIVLGAAATAPILVNCSSPSEEDEGDQPLSEDAVTGVNNVLGLGLRYTEKEGRLYATLKENLKEGEKLYVKVYQGKATYKGSADVDCAALAEAPATAGGKREATGKVIYQGPQVTKRLIDLMNIYDNEGWQTRNGIPAAVQEDVKKNGGAVLVDACVVKGSTVKARLRTSLAQAWDNGTLAEKQLSALSGGLRFMAGDGGLGDGSAPDAAGADAAPPPSDPARLIEGDRSYSQREYGQLCVDELGEIPFFPKIGPGKYETFDCRDLVASNGTKPAGVEGAGIPAFVNGVQVEKCSPGRELGPETSRYDCLDKADHGMYLDSGGTQPGPMVVTAKNDKGTHWLLLCRKVADDGNGMMKTKKFNDMAMIGHNPKTGRTCFFQNAISSGTDGAHVPHPADVEKSISVWSDNVQSYCTGNCHAADAFVHSRWIDGAKRANGKPIVPRLGDHPDFPISALDAPYNIINGDSQGFEIPKQIVNPEVGPCANCHRLTVNRMAGDFSEWSTGTGEEYFSKITDYGKKFEESHWMPLNLAGLNEANWKDSKYFKALEFAKKCNTEFNAPPECEYAPVPRGNFNNPKVTE